MDVTVIKDKEAFYSLKKEWNELLEYSHSSNIFLTWEWMYTWWKYYGHGKGLFIVIIRDREGRLLGIAPLCIRKVNIYSLVSLRVLTFLGTEEVCSDHMDFIVNAERYEDVLNEILCYIGSLSKPWDYVFLSNLLDSSPSVNYIKEFLDHYNINYNAYESEVCPYITLSESYDDYIQGLSKNMRYNLKRRTRNLENRFDATFTTICNNSKDIENEMERLFGLHKKRRKMVGEKGDFLKSNLMAFHKELANLLSERDMLRIYCLNVNGDPISMLYGFIFNSTFFYYQSGMDPDYGKHSVGMVLMGHCIRDSIDNKLKEFDLLRGEEPYKYMWTDRYRKTINIAFSSNGLKGRSYIFIKSMLIKAKELIKERVSHKYGIFIRSGGNHELS